MIRVNGEAEGQNARAGYLDTKFVGHILRVFPKFLKHEKKEEFVFPKSLVDMVEGIFFIHYNFWFSNFITRLSILICC